MHPLTIRMFGPLIVHVAGEPVTGLGARQAAGVLAFLALRQANAAPCQVLNDTFWPGALDLDSMNHGIGALRKALGPEGRRVSVDQGWVRLDLDQARVDALEFDAAVARGDTASLEIAAALHCSPLLEGWPEEWVQRERGARVDRVRAALRRLAEDAADVEDKTMWLKRLVSAHPSDEWGWSALMHHLAYHGSRAAALDVLAECQTVLKRQYGLPPPPDMTALRRQLRAGASPEPPAAACPDGHHCDAEIHVGGAMPLGSPLYIRRSIDDTVAAAMARGDSILLIRGPVQSGKSSLLARGLEAARQAGAVVVLTNISALPDDALRGMGELCLTIARQMAGALDLDEDPATEWPTYLAPAINLERSVIRRVLPAAGGQQVIWAVDGVDRIFDRPYRDEFFSRIRQWHEKRAMEPERPWRRLTVALVCATEPHLYISDLNRSPFNVGTHVDVPDLTLSEIAELNLRIGSPVATESLAAFHALLGGHPALVVRALTDMSSSGEAWPECAQRILRDDGPFADHLNRLIEAIEADPDLLAAVVAVGQGLPCDERAFRRLRTAGVLSGHSHQEARFRCGLYARRLAAQSR